jgi:hypothetical protein
MEKLVFLTLLLLTVTSLSTSAQCMLRPDAAATGIFKQDASSKAALVAATDESIEARFDPKTGQIYYLRSYFSRWSGDQGYQLVVFDENLEIFLDQLEYASQERNPGPGNNRLPCAEKLDSTCIPQNKLLPGTIDASHKPRRSSTVKLASNSR